MGKVIHIKRKGDHTVYMNFLKELLDQKYLKKLDKYGEEGVKALSLATPVDTGKTAASWEYKILDTSTGVKIVWYNTNEKDGENIAILIQYGHGLVNGGYVPGPKSANRKIPLNQFCYTGTDINLIGYKKRLKATHFWRGMG